MKHRIRRKNRLSFEHAGTQNRKPVYIATGIDSIDGSPTSYQIFNEGGVYRLSGDNVRRTGGQRILRSVSEGKRLAEKIDDAAERAFQGGYSLTKDLV